MRSLVPSRCINEDQNTLVNFVSLSLTMAHGMPCNRMTSRKKTSAVSIASSVVRHAIKCQKQASKSVDIQNGHRAIFNKAKLVTKDLGKQVEEHVSCTGRGPFSFQLSAFYLLIMLATCLDP